MIQGGKNDTERRGNDTEMRGNRKKGKGIFFKKNYVYRKFKNL